MRAESAGNRFFNFDAQGFKTSWQGNYITYDTAYLLLLLDVVRILYSDVHISFSILAQSRSDS